MCRFRELRGMSRVGSCIVAGWLASSLFGVARAAPEAATATVELDSDKQRFIWDLEHITFKIEKRFREIAKRRRAVNALATWIDFDNDGFADLLLGGRRYRNRDGAGFDDVTQASGLRFDRVPLGCNVADYNGDGRLDRYVLYQKGFDAQRPAKVGWVGDAESGARNQLWRNEGNGRFKNTTITSRAGGGKRQTFAAATFYFDDDVYPDIYVANDFGKNILLRNRGNGTFVEVGNASGAGDFATSMGGAAGDLDNDGRNELYVANMFSKMGRRIIAHVETSDYPEVVHEQIVGSCAGNRLYLPGKDGGYREVSEQLGVNGVGWAYAPAMTDLNRDGWLDIYSSTGFMSFGRFAPDG